MYCGGFTRRILTLNNNRL